MASGIENIGMCCILSYMLLAWALAIAASSIMIHQNKEKTWSKKLTQLYEGENSAPYALMKSWEKQPFVDIRVLDAEEYPYCPDEYPEDVVYDIWLGTRAMCDCLEREGDRLVEFDKMCDKTGEDGNVNEEDCLDVPALSPMVLNVVNGVRYCGKRGGSSLR